MDEDYKELDFSIDLPKSSLILKMEEKKKDNGDSERSKLSFDKFKETIEEISNLNTNPLNLEYRRMMLTRIQLIGSSFPEINEEILIYLENSDFLEIVLYFIDNYELTKEVEDKDDDFGILAASCIFVIYKCLMSSDQLSTKIMNLGYFDIIEKAIYQVPLHLKIYLLECTNYMYKKEELNGEQIQGEKLLPVMKLCLISEDIELSITTASLLSNMCRHFTKFSDECQELLFNLIAICFSREDNSLLIFVGDALSRILHLIIGHPIRPIIDMSLDFAWRAIQIENEDIQLYALKCATELLLHKEIENVFRIISIEDAASFLNSFTEILVNQSIAFFFCLMDEYSDLIDDVITSTVPSRILSLMEFAPCKVKDLAFRYFFCPIYRKPSLRLDSLINVQYLERFFEMIPNCHGTSVYIDCLETLIQYPMFIEIINQIDGVDTLEEVYDKIDGDEADRLNLLLDKIAELQKDD